MELLANLSLGFQTAVSPENLLYCLVGALIGTLIGVLPGIGPVQTIAILMPTTFALPPVSALIMLAGIYYGAQYGGSTTSILVNVPGEASSVVTCLDGYQMARQGRAGAALTIAALVSFVAGSFATLVLAVAGGSSLRTRVQIRSGRILLAHGFRVDRIGRAGLRFHDQGGRHDCARPAAGHDRHRCHERCPPVRLRHPRTRGRHWIRISGHGPLRHLRHHQQPREAREAGHPQEQADRLLVEQRRISRRRHRP